VRLIASSRTGRYAVVRKGGGLEIIDTMGTAPRTQLAGPVADFACIGTMVWALRDDTAAMHWHALADGREIRPAIALPIRATSLVATRSEAAPAAIACGDGQVLVHDTDVLPIDHEIAFPLGGRRIAAVADDGVHVLELGRREPIAVLHVAGDVRSVHALFGGKLIAVVASVLDEDVWTVFRPDGTRVQELVTPTLARWAVACEAGAALVALDAMRWRWLDLRCGVTRANGETPFSIADLDVSTDGRHALFATATSGDPQVTHIATAELLAGARRESIDVVPAEPPPEPLPIEPAPSPPPAPEPELALIVPRALGELAPPLAVAATGDWAPYATARAHFDDMLDLAGAQVARAIAAARNSGRLALAGSQRSELEVRALAGDRDVPALAPSELERANMLVATIADRVAGRVRATIVAGTRLPFVELMRELDLSPFAGHVAMIAIAVAERSEIARLVRILVDDPQRPLVDRGVLEAVLAGTDVAARAKISAELAPGAPLRRHGVVEVTGDSALAAITVDPIAIERCCGRVPDAGDVRGLTELAIAPDALRSLLAIAGSPRPAHDPLRLVLRGRRGSGRRSVIAALAAQIGRGIDDIDCARLPRDGAAMAATLAGELRRAVLRGRIPVVSGLELADPSDGEGQDRLRMVIRAHPGPVVVRTAHEAQLPIDPGAETVVLAALSETQRAAFWRAALARTAMTAPDADALAARWRISPGQIEAVIAQARVRPSASLDDIARQHIAARLGHVATPVRRLAGWEDVALPEDMIDSVREFVGRVSQRRTVLEDWGFDRKLSTSRGLTALFYGPPGTGKTMVAGVIARELGLELYRVDLSRVMSKWIGETEKNLGEVFDAAEDGQFVILFDEADSLFGKRTEVKTSNDRYANLEVNYILQRLDSFEGVAILTTNLDGAIDPAFKRRMSMRLQFPFPDEDIRKRLWAAHIPTTMPTANDFDFATLAKRFPLSGGYIRNSTLRAAFIAAQERRPLSHDHLLRAIALEYREVGKLATDGRME
jgi:hypothetical protein